METSKRELKVKRKNYSWLGSYQTWVPILISTKFPVLVMFLRVMSSEGDVQPVWEEEVWPPIPAIATFRTILHVASMSQRSSQLLTTKSMTDPEDEGGDGVPQQGHRGEAPQQLQAQD
jgi:hypothetical protein